MLEELEKKRLELGLNHKQFALKLGVSPQLWTYYRKHGKRSYKIERAAAKLFIGIAITFLDEAKSYMDIARTHVPNPNVFKRMFSRIRGWFR